MYSIPGVQVELQYTRGTGTVTVYHGVQVQAQYTEGTGTIYRGYRYSYSLPRVQVQLQYIQIYIKTEKLFLICFAILNLKLQRFKIVENIL